MILQYHGISTYSRLQGWYTRAGKGGVTHTAWLCADGLVYESWPAAGGVVCAESFSQYHTPGTAVDVYDVDGATYCDRFRTESFLLSQCGCRYDYGGIVGFLLRSPRPESPDKWFCSELVYAALESAGISLLARTRACEVDPVMIQRSPLLRYRYSLVCGSPGAVRTEKTPGILACPAAEAPGVC